VGFGERIPAIIPENGVLSMDLKRVYKKLDLSLAYSKLDLKAVYGRSFGEFVIGSTSGESAFLNLDVLKTHLHLIGLTGTGKSFFLELLARELLHMGKGFCLIDPLGFLYDSLLNYISYHPQYAERIVFFNPGQPSNLVVGYNPFKFERGTGDRSAFVRALAMSLIKVFETDPSVAQRLSNTLQQALIPTVDASLTPYELMYFVIGDTTVRNRILAQCSDPIVRDFWKRFDSLPNRTREEKLGSLENRILEFARRDMIKATLGQTSDLIDVHHIVENNKILLVRLAETTWLSQSDGYIIGTLLVNELHHHAMKRSQADAAAHPFYVIIDEFQHFLTPDASRALATWRQKGMHLVLAHQHLKQLENEHLNPKTLILDAVMAEARSKVIFATYPADAKILAEYFAPEWNLKELKHRLYRTTVLNYELEKHVLEGWGHVTSTGDSFGSSRGTGKGGGVVTTESTTSMPDDGFLMGADLEALRLNKSVGEYESAIDSWNEAYGSQTSESDISSTHETLVLRPVLGQEIASEEFWTYQEQQFRQAAKLMNLDTQYAIVKVKNSPSMMVKIKTLTPYPADQEKIVEAYQVSKSNSKDVYLTYSERVELWKKNQDRLKSGVEAEEMSSEESSEPVQIEIVATKGKTGKDFKD